MQEKIQAKYVVYEIQGKKKKKRLPAAQHPIISPHKSRGVLVIFTSIHPSAEPMMNVKRIFNGINHLHIYSFTDASINE